MHIRLVTPAPPRSRKGNRVTAVSWARTLRALGHRVTVMEDYAGQPCDVLVALHAKRSHPAVRAYRQAYPHGPLIVVMTGTDLYVDLPDDPAALESVALADRLVVLQAKGIEALPAERRDKARIIVQSVAPRARLAPVRGRFDVAVVGHLRPVKDPFLVPQAARLLPATSRVRVLHAGGALEPEMERQARREMQSNPRYTWLGELPRWKARRLIARSRLMVLPSRQEGGANVVGEAVTSGIPVLGTAIDGTIGLLGADYPGYFPPGDAPALARLLHRAESDPAFLGTLESAVQDVAPTFDPQQERAAWFSLLAELRPG